jgi:FAD/FMN-containing dehydrogenase
MRYLGALQNTIWESSLASTETCLPFSAREQPCHQGRIPLYGAVVESTEEVQTAVRFASKYNIRLIIRNTGHDGAGSSSGPDSFQIFTHRLDDIRHHSNFCLSNTNSNSQMCAGTAVSIGAGVMFRDLYAQGAGEGFVVTGGDSGTVGAAGGFLQGGGVPAFTGYTWGLAVDNVLEFEVVVATVRDCFLGVFVSIPKLRYINMEQLGPTRHRKRRPKRRSFLGFTRWRWRQLWNCGSRDDEDISRSSYSQR